MPRIVRSAVGIVLILLGSVIAYGELGHALQGCFGCWVAFFVCVAVVAGGGFLVLRRRRDAFGVDERPA